MAESPNDISKLTSLERQPSQVRRYPDMSNSPITPSQNDWRGSSSFQPVLQQKKIFGFQIFIDNDILRQFEDLHKWFQSIINSSKVEEIKFNTDLSIPDLNGQNIQVYDRDMQKKYQACRFMLNDVYQKFKKAKNQTFSIIIFVPEGMVSLLIGTKGHQINKIMKQSHTTIVVNQPINRMTYRTVKIQGYHTDIARACRIIYEILEEKSSIAYSIEKQPSQLDYSKAKVKTKFIFSSAALEFIQNKNKYSLRKVEEQTKSSIKFRQDTSSRLLKRDEDLCIISGKLEDVQAMLVMLINFIQQYYNDERKATQYTLKMLIPSNYVTKLIGQKGYMIRDIIQRSGGAQIKILSDKQSERDIRQCVISINGTKENKIDASCLILEQIECFKNGGPILQSGKSINENLAQQFKNSIPLRIDQNNQLVEQQFIQEININQTTSAQVIAEEIPQNFQRNATSQMELQKSIDIVLQNPPKTVDPPSLIEQSKEEIEEQKEKEDIQSEEGMILDKTPIKEAQAITTVPIPALPPLALPQFLTKSKTQQASYRRIPRLQSSRSHSKSKSASRSRDRRSKRGKKNEGKQRNRSKSSSVEFKHEKEYVEIKIIVPKKLALDHKELRYIQKLSKSEIVNLQQKVEGGTEAIISVRGSLKDNTHCLKLIQKRLSRMSAHNSSTVR